MLAALFVCLTPTTVSSLLNAISIAGKDRLVKCNVIAKNGHVIELAADIDVWILDKTGTLTYGNRQAQAFMPLLGRDEKELARLSQLASLSDDTAEGRSIIMLAKTRFGIKAEAQDEQNAKAIPFSEETRMSGLDYLDEDGKVVRQIRKGAVDVMKKHIESLGGVYWAQIEGLVQSIAQRGGTPLLVSDEENIIGIIHLEDIVKIDAKACCKKMRNMGIRTILITGDNALTAAAIAAECGVDDFVAEATPEIKLAVVKREQLAGRCVGMVGDGASDAPSLAQADVGISMNIGAPAARRAANIIDLDSSPTNLVDIVKVGKQILMTRGILTLFGLSSGIVKIFAILPVMLGGLYATQIGGDGPLSLFNIMGLNSGKSAILSTVIFNALVILGMLPVALRGVNYHGQSAYAILRSHALIYGLGGLLVTFAGIKLIDMVLVTFHAV